MLKAPACPCGGEVILLPCGQWQCQRCKALIPPADKMTKEELAIAMENFN